MAANLRWSAAWLNVQWYSAATYHASDGLCTHAQVHLAGGFVMGHIIECPKHNGRFGFTTGEAPGVPAWVNLKTYLVKVIGGKDSLNPSGWQRPWAWAL